MAAARCLAEEQRASPSDLNESEGLFLCIFESGGNLAHAHFEPASVGTAHKLRVGVFGATGYTGQLLIELLRAHPYAALQFATSERESALEDGTALIRAEEAPLDSVDAAFLCLPNGVSGAVAARAVAAGVRVVDLSADLRLESAALYEQTYRMPHPAPQLLPAPYGLPEIARSTLHKAPYIANPGCHVTAVLLALYPLARAGALSDAPIIADTKTGVSGAGKEPKPESMFCEVYGDVKPYNIGRKHRHVPEIEQMLDKLQPDRGALIFAPHLVPLEVGLLATVYATLKPEWTLERAYAEYQAAYAGEPLIKLHPLGRVARIREAAHRNGAVVGVSEGAGNTLILTCAIDNLRKGASAQALQNFNLMFGLPETAGLV
ncbi:MAG: N-acetyl-gamma-glutamyl-phosphate reductase [Candidatus Thermofonsia Clade 1 bacterium]|jgi:N-acetyl-gamma-glutamyl-phosphate reductase|uniref:N-acetyl-gamma-glutamyl-phosphate reductase n=1 Tax=Candidatus Thermofonsia Clade 1 bacterium TaxID=2364210 RepID=A0A2M8PE69_9CHLR|nr:MAG: N-acetyl-gamma-glutamyl-phosphate reductase [Candidatus Thermofonsia Clade 1 bacterium]PJF43409.1 MAG: N-acetyl-gamma-glutamyl-phosphate reductase [Candidatus Thermofonsia Clade 1 bacterium]RMF52911.1 MAG: N-acetyl-gamma-glutamyl-phosphate reductase [Chloroflexota bacterium]